MQILIVGGGLSGLRIATHLHAAGHAFDLFEARTRFGGRVFSPSRNDDGRNCAYDLGPAWFWPNQPLIQSLIGTLGLRAFTQFTQGDLLHETNANQPPERHKMAMSGGYKRLHGGVNALIQAMVETLPSSALFLDHTVNSIEESDDEQAEFKLSVAYENAGKAKSSHYDHVVIALPPRLAAESIRFDSLLGDETLGTMRAIPTWMAGHAKLLAVYERPFWREDSLSGEAFSQIGPLAQIHDASQEDGSQGALFGFVGLTAEQRQDESLTLEDAGLEQLTRLFGPLAGKPEYVVVQDWINEHYTSTALDFEPLHAHPSYTRPAALTNVANGRLLFSSAELDTVNGGLLEGALRSADDVARQILKALN